MATKGDHVVNPRNAKSKGYGKVIRAIADTKQCPFCPDNFKYHKKPILRRSHGWFITENSWPYKNSQKHFLIIALKHKETLAELTLADTRDILHLAAWAVKTYGIKGGGLTMRFGDTNYTGATVAHLHAHLIYPEAGKKGPSKVVNFPIG